MQKSSKNSRLSFTKQNRLKRTKRQRKEFTKQDDFFDQQIQIVDPLNQQIGFFQDHVAKSVVLPEGKGYRNLKEYLQQQNKYLKKIKLQKMEYSKSRNTTTTQQQPFNIATSQVMISIPQIGQHFKNQVRDLHSYENKQLCNNINERISSLEDSINRYSPFKNQSFLMTQPTLQEANDDRLIRDRQKGKTLIKRIQKLKLSIRQQKHDQKLTQSYVNQPLNLLNQQTTLKKKKVLLKGTRSLSVRVDEGIRKVLTPVALLYKMNNVSQLKQRKQIQLDALIKNESQNRKYTMKQKQNYYSQSIPAQVLSPRVQYKMRQKMNNKLIHRLKATKDQATDFSSYISFLKQSRVIICNPLQQIFTCLRSLLLSGKILRDQDFLQITQKYSHCQILKSSKNSLILKKIRAMMI